MINPDGVDEGFLRDGSSVTFTEDHRGLKDGKSGEMMNSAPTKSFNLVSNPSQNILCVKNRSMFKVINTST